MANECMAHRGWSGQAPENTMAAIHKALSEPWIGWMEIDVQLSSDGVPVLIHDLSLERTTNGSGRVVHTPFERLQALDAGSWFSMQFAGEPVPSLEEVLQATVGRCRLNIELKTGGGIYPELEQRVLDLVYRYSVQYDIMITSFDPESLRKVKRLAPEVTTGLIINANPSTLLQDLQQLDASVLSIGYTHLTKPLAQKMIAAGIQIVAWTIDRESDIRRIAAIDPSIMICTNHPDSWYRALVGQY